jgi:hypothetical protein
MLLWYRKILRVFPDTKPCSLQEMSTALTSRAEKKQAKQVLSAGT